MIGTFFSLVISTGSLVEIASAEFSGLGYLTFFGMGMTFFVCVKSTGAFVEVAPVRETNRNTNPPMYNNLFI